MAAVYPVRWKLEDERRAERPQTWPFLPGQMPTSPRLIFLDVAPSQLHGGRMP